MTSTAVPPPRQARKLAGLVGARARGGGLVALGRAQLSVRQPDDRLLLLPLDLDALPRDLRVLDPDTEHAPHADDHFLDAPVLGVDPDAVDLSDLPTVHVDHGPPDEPVRLHP